MRCNFRLAGSGRGAPGASLLKTRAPHTPDNGAFERPCPVPRARSFGRGFGAWGASKVRLNRFYSDHTPRTFPTPSEK